MSSVQNGSAQYGILLAGDLLVALAQPRTHPLHAHDLLVASSFVRHSASFAAAPESFSPLCLPCHNASAFLHAYITYLLPVRPSCNSCLGNERSLIIITFIQSCQCL